MTRWWQSFADFCNHYGNIASCFGLFIAVIGFVATFWRVVSVGRIAKRAQEEIREQTAAIRGETRATLKRIGLELISQTIGDVLRLIKELREASQRGEWLRATDKCQDSRHKLMRVVENPHLTDAEQRNLRPAITNLAMILQYIDRHKLNKQSPPKGLHQPKSESLEKIAELLGQIQARLQQISWEI